MKTLFDRVITISIFLICVVIASCVVGMMSTFNHAETPLWIVAALGLSAAIMSISACAWGATYDNHK